VSAGFSNNNHSPNNVGHNSFLKGIFIMARLLTSAQLAALISTAATVASSTAVTAATNANPCVITSTAHGMVVGDLVLIENIGGATGANGLRQVTAVADANTLAVVATPGGAYTSGGTVKKVTLAKLAANLTTDDLENLLAMARQRKQDPTSPLKTLLA
jgi:hypothetical protein